MVTSSSAREDGDVISETNGTHPTSSKVWLATITGCRKAEASYSKKPPDTQLGCHPLRRPLTNISYLNWSLRWYCFGLHYLGKQTAIDPMPCRDMRFEVYNRWRSSEQYVSNRPDECFKPTDNPIKEMESRVL